MSQAPQLPKALISAVTGSKVNAFIVETFLTGKPCFLVPQSILYCKPDNFVINYQGLYTVLFIQAIYRLVLKGNKHLYIAVLTVLWGLVLAEFAVDWEEMRLSLTVYNDTASDMALHLADGDTMPKVDDVLDSIFMVLSVILGDSLLIWRCHLLWSGDKRNKYITGVLAALLTGTTVVGFVFWNPRNHFSNFTESALTGVFFLLSSTTTLVGTLLIVARILIVSRRSKSPHSYSKLIEILVESSMLYSAAMILSGILELILLHDYNHPPKGYALLEAATCAGMILTPLTGIAPTLIALRVGNERQDTEPVFESKQGRRVSLTASRNVDQNRGILSALRFARSTTTSSSNDSLEIRHDDSAATDSQQQHRIRSSPSEKSLPGDDAV